MKKLSLVALLLLSFSCVAFSSNKFCIGPIVSVGNYEETVLGDVRCTENVFDLGSSLFFRGISESWLNSIGFVFEKDFYIFQYSIAKNINKVFYGFSANYSFWSKKFNYPAESELGFGFFYLYSTSFGDLEFGYRVVRGLTRETIIFWNPFFSRYDTSFASKELLSRSLYISLNVYLY